MVSQETQPELYALPLGDAGSAAVDLEHVFRRHSSYVAKIGYRLLGRDHEVDAIWFKTCSWPRTAGSSVCATRPP